MAFYGRALPPMMSLVVDGCLATTNQWRKVDESWKILVC